MKHALIGLGALLGVSALAGPTLATSVQALDNWGRYVVGIDLDQKFDPKLKGNRYTPKATLIFLVPNADTDDVALAQFYRDNKPLGDAVRCPVARPLDTGGDRQVVVAQCKLDLDKLGQTKPGKYRLTVGYRQTARGVDHADLATYTFAVGQHTGAGNRAEYHIDKDFRMGEAWAHQMQDGGFQLYTWFKVSHEESTQVARVRMRCFVGDKQWDFHETTNDRYRYEFDDYAAAGAMKKTRWQYNYFFPPGDVPAFLRDNPGDYRCTITRGGELDRELYFTIADGKPVKPACQQGDAPLVRAPASTTLIRQVFKSPQDMKFDGKAYEAGALYGRVAKISEQCGF